MDGLPHRARKVVGQVLGLLDDRLHFQLGRLLRRLEAELDAKIPVEQDGELLADWLASRQGIRRSGDGFAPAFMASLRQACGAAYARPASATPAFVDLAQPLRLLDPGIVDEEGALAGMAARHESRASLPLVLLGQRFAVLLERPPLAARQLPIGPHAFAQALRHAAMHVGLALHGRMALYRLYDLEHGDRYEGLMQAADRVVDEAGVLRGLSFVPLRRREAADHPDRGRGPATTPPPVPAGQTPDVVAMRTVNAALDALVPQGTLPEARLGERREAIAAMVRLVCQFGAGSPEWARARATVAEVVAAAKAGRAVAPATRDWMRDVLRSLGYAPAEQERLSLAMAHFGADIAAGQAADPAAAAEREWQRRLSGLPEGATLGFTREGGVTRAQLRRRTAESDRLLLASEEEDREAWVDTDVLARLFAEGNAWLVASPDGGAP